MDIENKMSNIHAELNRTDELYAMLHENVSEYYTSDGFAGYGYSFPKNRNASKTAILNQITTLRNELLVLADTIRK